MIFDRYLIKLGKASFRIEYFNNEEQLMKEETCVVYFKGQLLSKKPFDIQQGFNKKQTNEEIYSDDLILNINNNIDGKFIFSNDSQNLTQKNFFIGIEFYQKNKLILKIFNDYSFTLTKEFPQDFQEFLVRALIKTNFEEKYEIKQFLGRGGFSYVYQGIQRENNKKIAIKKIEKLRLMQINNGAELIYSEILIMKKLDHPNIVKLIDVYQSKCDFYLIMEFLEGPTLQNIFKSKFDSLLKIQQFSQQFLKLLKYLEINGILHNDIKPSNIIFKNNNINPSNFSLIDFGLSVQINKKQQIKQCYGTIGYMAPELMKKKINYQNILKADIYSFGCLLYLLYFSTNVFRGNYEEVERQNYNNELPQIIINSNNNQNTEKNTICFLLKAILTKSAEERISLNELISHPFFGIVNNKNQEIKNDSDFQFEDMKEYENNFIQNQIQQLNFPEVKFKCQKLEYAKGLKEFEQSTELTNSYLQYSYSKKYAYLIKK